jgi:hypothetical protein
LNKWRDEKRKRERRKRGREEVREQVRGCREKRKSKYEFEEGSRRIKADIT